MKTYALSKPLLAVAVRAGALMLVILSGLFTAFISQASSPDYRSLFWYVLLYAGVHGLMAIAYFFRVRHWTRWVAAVTALLVLACVAEMGLRVFDRVAN